MRKIIIGVVLFLCLLMTTCITIGNRADGLMINGSYHEPVGLLSLNQKDPDVCYEAVFGNIVWSVLLIETIVIPIYLIGWHIYEPVPDERCPYRE